MIKIMVSLLRCMYINQW